VSSRKITAKALCKAQVQCPRGCGGLLVNGLAVSACLDLADLEACDAKASGQQKTRSWRGFTGQSSPLIFIF